MDGWNKRDTNTREPSLFPEWDEEIEGQAEQATACYDHTALFERLAQSAFRSKFRLSAKDKAYIHDKGMATIRNHAAIVVVVTDSIANIINIFLIHK